MRTPQQHRWSLVSRLSLLLTVGATACIPDVVPTSGPSCNKLSNTCGSQGTESCCASSVPVLDGTYNRYNDSMLPATVSTFLLDRYMVTVGRFRRFVQGYPGNLPKDGAGERTNPPLPGSGWNMAWKDRLPPDRVALENALECSSTHTWTRNPGLHEENPIDCVSWYLSFAFCVWDGGRLPTEAEWLYAASGGESRPYPWGDNAPDDTHAVYCKIPKQDADCPLLSINSVKVGSKSPEGDGRWGQADLVGSLWEWTLDEYSVALQPTCVDCSNIQYPPSSPPQDGFRVILGGSWRSDAASLKVDISNRRNLTPSYPFNDLGVRCARDL